MFPFLVNFLAVFYVKQFTLYAINEKMFISKCSLFYRYGHSQIGMFYNRLQSDYIQEDDPSIRVFEGLFFHEAVLNGSTPAIMRGLMLDPAKMTDLLFVEDVRK